VNKENKPAAMIRPTYLSQSPFQTHFKWCCSCNISPGTRPVQWDWNGNEKVVAVKLSAQILRSIHQF